MRKLTLLTIASGLTLALAACSTAGPMSTGERISQRGANIGGYGQDWTAGQNDVAQGQRSVAASTKNLAEGEKDLERAREQVAKAEDRIRAARSTRANGERLIEDGTGQMQRAEAAYAATKAGPSAVPPGN